MQKASLTVTQMDDGTLKFDQRFDPPLRTGEALPQSCRLVADAFSYLIRVYDEDEIEAVKVNGKQVYQK